MEKKVRVRFSPSPTGSLNIGGLRTALFNYLFAKKNGGDFILRIEDTDTERLVLGAEEYIVKSLKWCGIEPNEGFGFGDGPYAPYKQSERNTDGIYRPFIDKLIADGTAYYAFDTKSEVEAMKEELSKKGAKSPSYNSFNRMMMRNSLTLKPEEVKQLLDANMPYVVRIKMPQHEIVDFTDIIRGKISISTNTLDDKVLWKSNGLPTYHLANVVDDILMKITHVIRGEEWLPSTGMHVILRKYLGEGMIEFAHLPLILKPQKEQLEKLFINDIKNYEAELDRIPWSEYYIDLLNKSKTKFEEFKLLSDDEFTGKLSKRDGDRFGFPVIPLTSDYKNLDGTISKGFKEEGYLPQALVNILALLGWNPGTDIISLNDMIQKFDLTRVSKSGARFDLKKAEWINKHYLQNADSTELANLIKKDVYMLTSNIVTNLMGYEDFLKLHYAYIVRVCELMKHKIHNLNQILTSGKYFFTQIMPSRSIIDDMKKIWNRNFVFEMRSALSKIDFDNITADELHRVFENVCAIEKIDPRNAGKLLRMIITNVNVGPPIFDIILLFGKERVLQIIDKSLLNKTLI